MNKSLVIILVLLVVSVLGVGYASNRDSSLAPAAASSGDICEDMRKLAATMTSEEYCASKYELSAMISSALYQLTELPSNPSPTDSENPIVQLFLHPMAFPYLNENIALLRQMQECLDEIDLSCG